MPTRSMAPTMVSPKPPLWVTMATGPRVMSLYWKPEPKPAAAPEPEPETKRVTLEQAITVLNSLGTKRMGAVHALVTGKPAKGLKKPAMFKAIAAALAEKADGKGASATLPDEAVGWLADAKDAKQGSEERGTAKKESKPRDPRLPEPGSVITKVWRDRTLEVQVGETDFTFEGRTYGSLSKIASELLQCCSNGYLFFALTEGAKAATAKREAKAVAKLAAAEEKAKEQEQVIEKPEKTAKKKATKKAKPSKKTAKA